MSRFRVQVNLKTPLALATVVLPDAAAAEELRALEAYVLQVRRLRSRGGLLRSRGGLLRICSRRTRVGCVCVCVCRQLLSGFFPYPSNLFDVEKHHI